MRIIKEYKFEHEGYNVVVLESATNWYVTLRFIGYDQPCLFEHKVTKRKVKSLMEATDKAIEFYDSLGI